MGLRRCLVVLALASLGSCAAPARTDSLVLSKDLAVGAVLWEKESLKVAPNALVVAVHGGTRDGEWYVKPDKGPRLRAREFLWTLRHTTDRPIVCLICNEGGHKTDVPNVWYSPKGVVWATPDKWWAVKRSEGVGSIEGMVKTEEK